MRLGVHIVAFDQANGHGGLGPRLASAGAAAEAAGVGWLSVMDHYFQMEELGGAQDAMLECYTTLGYLAAHTSTVQLGALVTGVTYRHPGLLAKIVTTLDNLSGGRATLGIGAAWYEREHRGLGVPFPPTAERFGRLEETLRICLQMWDPRHNGPFDGTYYQLTETRCVPPPVSVPRPEIMIGGGGEKKTLRLVAQYADACNLTAFSIAEVAHKLDVLHRHCDEAGRDYGQIRKTAIYAGDTIRNGDLDAFAKEMTDYSKLGIETMIVTPAVASPAQWIEDRGAPAARRLAELG
ncbi:MULTISPECIES: LLM class F420-dependent oxidoreductase [unclassified Pseudofrankia]|uniref:LLM class F420-dependent oxidoreductase n=1 Tax=unclassified Pseudofrankia TaxID=2994372 RepID=UPI0008DA9A7C|nr:MULTISPECIES: LLM class F420-dependent oxidoreductase [unclassified Pseudofrankia]MDT3439222.1 LLM class F420-dependent oxidoreductase [Pseudofrankia sp. BMG5.37]OHV43861.1 LLM class F420-dependent oxidoreductase [Pseudofrankia sp. BMG5.36]